MSGESEWIWKELVVANLKVVPWHLPGETGKTHERLQSG